MLLSQTKPTLATSKVWSATDMYEFVPVDATWAGGVITFTSKNHGLVSNDSVNIVCLYTGDAWDIGTVTATVLTNDTFTVPLASDPGSFPNASPYPVNNINRRVIIKVPKYSKTFYLQNYLQIDSLGTATGLKLQAKLNDEAKWIDVAAFNNMVVGITKMTDMYNFMRLTPAGGTTVTLPTVYTQKNYTA